jgi:hypothetical protein
MRQGPELNNFYKMKFKYPAGSLKHSKEAEYVIADIIEMKIRDKALLTPTVHRLLDMLSIQLTEGDSSKNTVYLPLEKYKAWVNATSDRNAKHHLKKDMEALDAILFNFASRSSCLVKKKKKEPPREEQSKKGLIRVSGGPFGFTNDNTAFFTLSDPFHHLLKHYYIANFDSNAFKLEVDKYPNAYYISRYLDINYNMNCGKDSLAYVNASTLLEECSQIAPIKCVGRKWRERIIRPFFRDLNAVGIDYKILSGETELDKTTVADTILYKDFIKTKLVFDYSEHIQKIGNPRLKAANE